MSAVKVEQTPVQAAALWLATTRRNRSRPIVLQLRERFGLTAVEAVAAIHEANLRLARAL